MAEEKFREYLEERIRVLGTELEECIMARNALDRFDHRVARMEYKEREQLVRRQTLKLEAPRTDAPKSTNPKNDAHKKPRSPSALKGRKASPIDWDRAGRTREAILQHLNSVTSPQAPNQIVDGVHQILNEPVTKK